MNSIIPQEASELAEWKTQTEVLFARSVAGSEADFSLCGHLQQRVTRGSVTRSTSQIFLLVSIVILLVVVLGGGIILFMVSPQFALGRSATGSPTNSSVTR